VAACGDTVCVPLAATAPIPWSMETLVAPVADHVRVAESPYAIVAGLPVKVITGFAPGTERVSANVWEAPLEVAEIVAVPGAVKVPVVALKVAELHPPLIVTLAGTVTAGLSLLSAIVSAAGASGRVTVQMDVAFDPSVLGVQVSV